MKREASVEGMHGAGRAHVENPHACRHLPARSRDDGRILGQRSAPVNATIRAVDGTERKQTGRCPAVVAQDETPGWPTILVGPLTSPLGALRFSHTLRETLSMTSGYLFAKRWFDLTVSG